VSPFVLVPVAAAAALFFGVVVAKVMRIRQLPPAQGPEAIVGREGVVLGTAVDQNGGVVRVAAEEWRAVTPTGRLEPGTKIKVTGLKGLVLTVQPVDRTHASTGAQATAEEGGTS
jgi:membrane protein implicated in regulation of membrane protease activity